MVSVPACPVTLTSVETNNSNDPNLQTNPKDARNRSAATAGCFETCFNIQLYAHMFTSWLSAVNATKKRAYPHIALLAVRSHSVLDEYPAAPSLYTCP
jgi:hypothetical protein